MKRCRLPNGSVLALTALLLALPWAAGPAVVQGAHARESEQGAPIQRLVGPRGYGIFFISLGLFTLLLATVQHRQSKILRAQYPEAPMSLSALLAAIFRQ